MPLAALLRLGLELERQLGLRGKAMLTRIDKGFAFRAPGVALALQDDRCLVIRWNRPIAELRRLYGLAAREVGVMLPISDWRPPPAAAPPDVGKDTGTVPPALTDERKTGTKRDTRPPDDDHGPDM